MSGVATTADRIELTGVRARGRHGVLAHERRDGQDFVVDVILEVDLGPACRSDDLTETVSYAEVADDVVAWVEGDPVDLIEVLAARIADDALARGLVEAVEVTVHKPEAPVGHPFTDVAVRIRRERAVPVVLALGANLGDPAAALARAVGELGRLRGTRVDAVSGLVDSDPVGGPDQPRYRNAVVLATTRLAPRSLLAALHGVESRHGRVRDVRWGPRTLDLDLVQYGDPRADADVVSADPALLLPHPRAAERPFVLRPWLEVDPEAVLRTPAGVARVADLPAATDPAGLRPAREDWNPAW